MGWPAASYRFILLPSLVGLSCYACSQAPKTLEKHQASKTTSAVSSHSPEPPGRPPEIPSAEVSAEKLSSPTATAESTKSQTADSQTAKAAYQAAMSLASSAYQLGQSAISPDDWGLVASRWQRAIEQLEKVNGNSDRHAIAQAKIEEYTRYAEHAASKITALQASANIEVISPKSSTAIIRSTPPAQTSQSVPAQPSSAARKSASNTTSIPIVRRLHGTPVVRVTFDGSRTYDMILDTGASRTLITRAMANDLKVIATERMLAATASESNVVFELGRVKSIEVGGIALDNPQISIGDSVSLGLLGNDFLRGYDVTIRGRENVVELTRS